MILDAIVLSYSNIRINFSYNCKSSKICSEKKMYIISSNFESLEKIDVNNIIDIYSLQENNYRTITTVEQIIMQYLVTVSLKLYIRVDTTSNFLVLANVW